VCGLRNLDRGEDEGASEVNKIKKIYGIIPEIGNPGRARVGGNGSSWSNMAIARW